MKAVICKAYGPPENLVLEDVEPLLKDCSIIGVFWGSFAARDTQHNQENLRGLLGWLQTGKLNPHISARYPLERAAEALNDFLQRKVMGKTVLVL